MQALCHAQADQVSYGRPAGRLTVVACRVQNGPLSTLHNRKVARPQIAMQQRWLHLHRQPSHAFYANKNLHSEPTVCCHCRRECTSAERGLAISQLEACTDEVCQGAQGSEKSGYLNALKHSVHVLSNALAHVGEAAVIHQA